MSINKNNTKPSSTTLNNIIITGERWKINVDIDPDGKCENGIRTHIYEREMKALWKHYFKINDSVFSTMSWASFTKVNKNNCAWKQIFMAKYNARILPVNKNLKRRKHSETDRCPNCGMVETTAHLFCCPATVIEEEFTKQMEEFQQHLGETTSYHLTKGIIALLCHLRSRKPLIFEGNIPDDIQTLVRKQASIGLSATLGGLWLEEWILKQDEYIKRVKLRISAKTWLPRILSAVQDILFNLWLARNSNMHKNEESKYSEEQHKEMNLELDDIFTRIPHPRLLSLDERRFFNTNIDTIKRKRRRRKNKWIKEANVILERYKRELTGQSAKFISYFAPD